MRFSLPLVVTLLYPILFSSVDALRLPPVRIGLPHGGVNNAASAGTSDLLESNGQKPSDHLLPNQFVDTRRKYSCAFDYDPFTLSMREARINMPLMALLSSVALTSPARADTLIPSNSFDLSLKAFFPTALTSKETADRIVRVLKDR